MRKLIQFLSKFSRILMQTSDFRPASYHFQHFLSSYMIRMRLQKSLVREEFHITQIMFHFLQTNVQATMIYTLHQRIGYL